MWILNWLPSESLLFIINAVLFVGIAATVTSFFLLKFLIRAVPTLAPYATLAQVISVVILTAGVYFKGGYSTEMTWRERVAELEKKVAEAEARAAQVNTKIETRVVTRTRVVKERGEDIVKYIDREIIKYDEKFIPGGVCEIPQEFIRALNDAAKAPAK